MHLACSKALMIFCNDNHFMEPISNSLFAMITNFKKRVMVG